MISAICIISKTFVVWSSRIFNLPIQDVTRWPQMMMVVMMIYRRNQVEDLFIIRHHLKCFFLLRLVGLSISRPVQRHRERERMRCNGHGLGHCGQSQSHTDQMRWDGSLIVQFLQHNNCNCSLTSEEEEKEVEEEDGNKTAFNRFLLLLFLLHKELNSLLRTAFPVTQSVCLLLDNNHHNHMRRAQHVS